MIWVSFWKPSSRQWWIRDSTLWCSKQKKKLCLIFAIKRVKFPLIPAKSSVKQSLQPTSLLAASHTRNRAQREGGDTDMFSPSWILGWSWKVITLGRTPTREKKSATHAGGRLHLKGGPPSPKQIATFSHISVTPLGSVHIRAGINKQTIESRSQNFHSSSQRMECQVERYHGCCIISARFLLSLSTALLFSLLANLFLLAVFLLLFFF